MVEKDFTPQTLGARLSELMENQNVLQKASKLAKQKATLNAAEQLCDAILLYLKKGKK